MEKTCMNILTELDMCLKEPNNQELGHMLWGGTISILYPTQTDRGKSATQNAHQDTFSEMQGNRSKVESEFKQLHTSIKTSHHRKVMQCPTLRELADKEFLDDRITEDSDMEDDDDVTMTGSEIILAPGTLSPSQCSFKTPMNIPT